MSTYTEEVGKKLNAILEKTYDAEKGFKTGSENAESTAVKTYFEKKASERRTFIHELKNEISKFGQEAEDDGSVSGTLHRGWMEVKSFFSSDSDEAMLEEAITGEKSAINEYREVLKETSLPSSTSEVLNRQMNLIAADLDTIKRMEMVS